MFIRFGTKSIINSEIENKKSTIKRNKLCNFYGIKFALANIQLRSLNILFNRSWILTLIIWSIKMYLEYWPIPIKTSLCTKIWKLNIYHVRHNYPPTIMCTQVTLIASVLKRYTYVRIDIFSYHFNYYFYLMQQKWKIFHNIFFLYLYLSDSSSLKTP